MTIDNKGVISDNVGYKQKWLSANLRCISCHTCNLVEHDDTWTCRSCNSTYNKINNSISFISEELAKRFHIVDTKNVSDHPYNATASMLIDKVISIGGIVLDCGAGFRNFRHERLIQVEIAPYSNIDVLAVNQLLPFSDNSFDCVFSFDVIEHVSDPFMAAKELARVLKPGGLLYIDMPFLQAEHGYPHHFFNATRMGLRQLFEGSLSVRNHIVPRSGHPMHVVWSILRTYHNSLPPNVRWKFSTLTVEDILSKSWDEWRDSPIGLELPENAQWILASTTQAILSKAGGESLLASIDVSDLPAFRK